MKKFLIAYFVFLICIFSAFSEVSFREVFNGYYRTMTILGINDPGQINFHVKSTEKNTIINEGIWKGIEKENLLEANIPVTLCLEYPELFITANTARNWGRNDGGFWQGRGINSIFSFGLELSGDFFSLNFRPEVWFSQNLDYEIIGTTSSSGYGDYWTVFDNLQRIGEDYICNFTWGQSGVHFFYKDLGIGFATENIVLGPSKFNNILLSDNAEGFPHFDFGTMNKISVGNLGYGEFKMIWGFLKESEFFDVNSSNDYGWISGSYLSFSPAIMPYLSLGFNHQYYKPLSDWDTWDLIRGIPFVDRSNSGTDTKDMMISITFDFLFPAVGFELYGEWARNDNFKDIQDLFKFPEHTQGYTLGISKILGEWDSKVFELSFEMTNLQQERTYEIRDAGPWYRHGWAGWTQGFTNKGQLIGAAIGPGGESQVLKLTQYTALGLNAFYLERWIHDKDYYYQIVGEADKNLYSEMIIGIEKVHLFSNWCLFGSFEYSLILHNNFENDNNLSNFHFVLGLQYKF